MLRKQILWLLVSLGAISGAAAQTTPQIQQTIRRGQDFFERGRWIDARHEFKAAREALDATQSEARQMIDYYLAVTAVELNRDDAVTVLREFEEQYPGSVYINDIYFALGSYYCSVGNMDAAESYFKQTHYNALTAKRREQYDIRMGYVEFMRGDNRKAYGYFNRISPRSEYADHALYYKSYIDYVENDLQRAKQGFQTLTRSEAYGEVAPYYLLQIEFREGNYRYVVEHGDDLARRSVAERQAEIERVVAESWFRLEDYNKTIAHLEAFGRTGGVHDRESSYLMGFSLYRSTRYDEAGEWLRKACGAKDALTQNASYHLADCYLRAGNKNAAMQSFAMAADEGFDAVISEDALFNYAKLQYELGGGAFNGAINVLQRYVEKYPSSPRVGEARTLLVAAYYNSRDYDAAYRAIKSMPSSDADIRAALQKIAYFRGLEAYSGGNLSEAKRYLAESASTGVSPKYAALNIFWQGEIAFAEKDYTVAAVKYDNYLKRAPRTEREYSLAWYNLGYCAFTTGQLDRAESSFHRFLDVHPAADRFRSDALNRLADISYAHRRFDEAVTTYARAAAGGGAEQQYARYKSAMAYGIMGQMDRKQKTLRQIVDEGRGDYVEPATYELAHSYIAQQRYSEGAKALERFVEQYPSSSKRGQALTDLGLAYLNLGDKTRSQKYYEQAVDAAPHSPEARDAMQGIREIYVSRGDVDGYFDYAARVGMESDLTQLSRDSLSFVAAQKLYLAQPGETAAKSLRSYLSSYPKGYYASDARYFLSDCYLKLGQKDEAMETLTELVGQGNNRYMLPALKKLSTLSHEAHRYEAAAKAYRQLFEVSSAASDREEAMLGYVHTTLATGSDEAVEQMALDVRAESRSGVLARREATYAYAEQLRRKERMSEAMPLYQELAKEVKSNEGSAAAYYVIEDLFQKGETAKAEKAVFAYSERSPKAYWLARSFILLGDIYARKGDAFQARATWQSVVDGYSPADDGIVDEAAKRIRNLK